ncbi:MAG: flagellar export chaperone FliS, partial [Candidatus Zixiibacteriota bacterium]
MNKDRLAEYQRSRVLNMSQIELVVMLYQGAIRFLNEAITLIGEERYDKSWQKFDRARRIVMHLCATLNPEAGDLTNKFAAIYAFVIEQISVANARRDVALARNCIDILTTLKSGWEELATTQAVPVVPEAGT